MSHNSSDQADAFDLTRRLHGKWFGTYGLAFCPAHDNRRTPALSIRAAKNGKLLLYCHAGCSFEEVLKHLPGGPMSKSSISPRHGSVCGNSRNRRFAETIWNNASQLRGTLAEKYLRCRGISTEISPALRFSANCSHTSFGPCPALIARVQGSDGFAIHRTYLEEATNRVHCVEKRMLGPCKGGAVRLSNEPGPLVVAEGIETSLSLKSGLLPGGYSLWAALSSSGIRSLRLPNDAGKLILALDGDDAGIQAGEHLSNRAHTLGWDVEWLVAPKGMDWNDVLINGGNSND